MSPTEIALVAIIVVLVIVVVAVVSMWWRHRSLRTRFGPEYDRVAAEHDSRLATDRHLRERERKHNKLNLRPLDAESQQRYSAAWQQVQAQFVETPESAIESAQELLVSVAAARGYPTEDHDEQMEQLSVEHSETLSHYREATNIHRRHQQGLASTEDLRQALVHYRALFADLLGATPVEQSDGQPTDGKRSRQREAGSRRGPVRR